MVMYNCNLSTKRRLRQEDSAFEPKLVYIMRLCLKETKPEAKKKKKNSLSSSYIAGLTFFPS